MSKQIIHVGVENPDAGFDRFIEVWNKAEQGVDQASEIHLNFEDLSALLSIMTPKRLELMKLLRKEGAQSIRALSKLLERDYKNVHTDVMALEDANLLKRNGENQFLVPWDVIDAQIDLAA